MKDNKKLNYRHFMRTRRYFALAVAAALGGAVILIGGLMQIPNVFDTRSSLKQDQERLLRLQRKAAALEQLQTDSVVLAQEDINRVLPSRKPLLELLNAVSFTASNAEVQITSLELSPGLISTQSAELRNNPEGAGSAVRTTTNSRGDRSEVMSIEIEIKGTLNQINDFIGKIEQVAPITNAARISLSEEQRFNDIPPADLGSTEFRSSLLLETRFFTQTVDAAVESTLPEVGADEQIILARIQNFIFPLFSPQQVIQGGLDDLFDSQIIGADQEDAIEELIQELDEETTFEDETPAAPAQTQPAEITPATNQLDNTL